MKKIIVIIFGTFLLSQVQIDTTKQIPPLDFSKGFNIPGIIPEKIPSERDIFLFSHENMFFQILDENLLFSSQN